MYKHNIAPIERTSTNVRALRVACLASAVALLAGCQPQQAKGPTESDQTVAVTYTVPDVTPVQAGTETVDRQGVTISVVPVPFTVGDTPSKTCVPVDTSSNSSSLLGGLISMNSSDPNAKKQYQITTATGVDFQPKSLTFTINLTNHTDHVMRLEGTVLTLNINSKQVQLSGDDTKAFLQGILTPGEAKSFTVGGPDWSHNAEESTINFSLYDVPLATDKAGTVTEKGQFSWTYQAKLQTKTAQTKKTVQTLALSPGEASSMGCPVGPATATASK